MDFLTLAMMMTPSLATSSQLSQVIISRILLVHLPRYLRPLEMASPVLSSSLVILFLALSLRALPVCLTSLSVLLVGVVFVLSLAMAAAGLVINIPGWQHSTTLNLDVDVDVHIVLPVIVLRNLDHVAQDLLGELTDGVIGAGVTPKTKIYILAFKYQILTIYRPDEAP